MTPVNGSSVWWAYGSPAFNTVGSGGFVHTLPVECCVFVLDYGTTAGTRCDEMLAQSVRLYPMVAP